MTIVIAAEKPSTSSILAPYARKHWPSADICFIHTIPYLHFLFDYPRGLKWSDYPWIGNPQYKAVGWAEGRWRPQRVTSAGELQDRDFSDEDLVSAEEIIFACDPDHTGALAFSTLLQLKLGNDSWQNRPSLWLRSLAPDDVEKTFGFMPRFIDAAGHLLRYGEAKRYIDFNWNANALAVLGRTARITGLAEDAPPMSKYALQLLFSLRDSNSISVGQAIENMSRWPGTGKYGRMAENFGSEASRTTIVSNLVDAELLKQMKIQLDAKRFSTHIEVAPKGHEYLRLLHPDCADLDLPFRISEWCLQGLEVSKPKIDRYIRTFFGKQIRYLSRMSK